MLYNLKKRSALLAMAVFCAFALAESPNETHGESRNCGAEKDSREPFGLKGDQTSHS